VGSGTATMSSTRLAEMSIGSPMAPTAPPPVFVAPLVLGVETSCDDTACAVVDGAGRVLASVVSSQLDAHRPYGGVVPEIASRHHLANWPAVSSEALARAGLALERIDAVAATRGPGLVGSLLVGLTLGKGLAWGLDRPFFAVHHLEGHLYSPFLEAADGPAATIPERFVGLVVSGGHTALVQVNGSEIVAYADTRDDAIGEAFDKLGKRMGLRYPQGPLVDELAEGGDAARYPLPIAVPGSAPYFSYSGLKTQTVQRLEEIERALGRRLDTPESGEALPREAVDLLAGFRQAAVGQVLDRVRRLHRDTSFEVLAVSGGVAANRLLRRELVRWAESAGVDLRLVPLRFAGDNAAMIAHAALVRLRSGGRADSLDAEAESRIPFARPPA
jgi:N6-L-threonylcarbamoyladenine synthase